MHIDSKNLNRSTRLQIWPLSYVCSTRNRVFLASRSRLAARAISLNPVHTLKAKYVLLLLLLLLAERREKGSQNQGTKKDGWKRRYSTNHACPVAWQYLHDGYHKFIFTSSWARLGREIRDMGHHNSSNESPSKVHIISESLCKRLRGSGLGGEFTQPFTIYNVG